MGCPHSCGLAGESGGRHLGQCSTSLTVNVSSACRPTQWWESYRSAESADGMSRKRGKKTCRNGNGAVEREQYYDANQVLTTDQKRLIRESWCLLAPKSTEIGKQIFLRIFEYRPSVKQMFPFRDAWGDELTRHPLFIEQARRFMYVIMSVIDDFECMRSLCGPRLIELGRRHVAFDAFLPDYFDVFVRAIVNVWAWNLKPHYTDEMAEAWRAFFSFIITHLKNGYDAEYKQQQQRILQQQQQQQ